MRSDINARIEREVLAIIETAIERPERLSPAAILAQVRQLGLHSPLVRRLRSFARTGMAVTVIDASAVVAVLFDEPEAKIVVDQLGESERVAPSPIDFEVANVCWLKVRRSPHRRTELLAAYRLRERFGIRHVPIDHEAVVALALETGLTAYDESYLW